MIQKLVDIIVKQQVEKGIISKEEVDIYINMDIIYC